MVTDFQIITQFSIQKKVLKMLFLTCTKVWSLNMFPPTNQTIRTASCLSSPLPSSYHQRMSGAYGHYNPKTHSSFLFRILFSFLNPNLFLRIIRLLLFFFAAKLASSFPFYALVPLLICFTLYQHVIFCYIFHWNSCNCN